jgi:hypothetical protein
MLLNRRQTAEKEELLEMLRKISPVAWQHIHFLGHYLLRNERQPTDLEAFLAHVDSYKIDITRLAKLLGFGLTTLGNLGHRDNREVHTVIFHDAISTSANQSSGVTGDWYYSMNRQPTHVPMAILT